MIARKQALSENIVGAGESWITEMSTDEIKDLFRLRREWLEEVEV
jgi:SNF2 family DNA or RNA helicase